MISAKVKGFTLIELMIVVALIAIVAMMAFPNFNPFINRNKAETVANNIESLVRKTRNTAITQGRPANIEISPDKWVSKDYTNNIIFEIAIPNEVKIKKSSIESKFGFDKQGILLNGSGLVESRTLSLYVCSGNSGKKLSIKSTASIVFEDGNGTICE